MSGKRVPAHILKIRRRDAVGICASEAARRPVVRLALIEFVGRAHGPSAAHIWLQSARQSNYGAGKPCLGAPAFRVGNASSRQTVSWKIRLFNVWIHIGESRDQVPKKKIEPPCQSQKVGRAAVLAAFHSDNVMVIIRIFIKKMCRQFFSLGILQSKLAKTGWGGARWTLFPFISAAHL